MRIIGFWPISYILKFNSFWPIIRYQYMHIFLLIFLCADDLKMSDKFVPQKDWDLTVKQSLEIFIFISLENFHTTDILELCVHY